MAHIKLNSKRDWVIKDVENNHTLIFLFSSNENGSFKVEWQKGLDYQRCGKQSYLNLSFSSNNKAYFYWPFFFFSFKAIIK
jgi:hypothetical protein